MPPSISLILPTYNMARFLPEAVESVLGQTFRDFELLIIDDGSTDDTKNLVEQYQTEEQPAVKYFCMPHRGKAAAINDVLSEHPPSGEFIAFMDADDLLPSDSLEKRYKAISSKKTKLVIGAFDLRNLAGETLERRELSQEVDKSTLLHRFYYGVRSPLHLNGMLVSKSLIAKTGLFDEKLTRGQEMDYAIRLLKNTDDFALVPEVVYHYRKYHRPLADRLKVRLQTIRCRQRWLGKHLNGRAKFRALAQHTLLDMMKFVYEAFRNYDK